MKHRSDTIESDPNPRTGTFKDLGFRRYQHGFDIPPGDIRPDRILKNSLKCLTMPRSHMLGYSIV